MATMSHDFGNGARNGRRFRMGFSLEGVIQLVLMVVSVAGGAVLLNYRMSLVEKQYAALMQSEHRIEVRTLRLEGAVNYLGQELYEKKLLNHPPPPCCGDGDPVDGTRDRRRPLVRGAKR